MAFGAEPVDSNSIPISCVYVPNVGFIALQGSSSTFTDGSSNVSTAAILSATSTQSNSGTLQSAQTANANGTALGVLGMGSVVFTINMSGFTGTVNFECSEDNTNYDPLYAIQSGTNTIGTSVVGSTTTSIHVYEASCANLQSVRARTSGVSAGNVTVTAHCTPLPLSPRVVNIANFPSSFTANAGTNLNTSALALESGGNLATIAGAISSSKAQANVSQINGVAPSMGNGVSGTGVQRVTLASDSTGQVALAAGANTVGAVTQASGPWTENLTQVAGSSVATATTGVQKVGIVGNTGATVDSTVAAGTAPTNSLVMGAVYNSSAPAPTTGQSMAMQLDQAGNQRMFPGMAMAALSAWNSSTSLNSTQNIFTNSGAAAVCVQLTQTSTLTAGAITFEVSYDGSTWNTIPANCVLDPTSTTLALISVPYTVQASTNKVFLLNTNGYQGLRIKLSTAITGTGSVTPNYALMPNSPADNVILASIAASLPQANQVPVSSAAPQGKLTLSGSLSANSDNSITFSGGASVARRIRIQNESAGTIYWETDTTASAGSPSLAAPASNAVSVEWIAIQCTTLHIFIPTGGTTTLNGTGGVKVTAYA